jgi:hypothetical protein
MGLFKYLYCIFVAFKNFRNVRNNSMCCLLLQLLDLLSFLHDYERIMFQPINTPTNSSEDKDLSSKTCTSSSNDVDGSCGSSLTSCIPRRSSGLNSPGLEKTQPSSSARHHSDTVAPLDISACEPIQRNQIDGSGSISLMNELKCQGDTARASVKPPSVDSIASLDDSSNGFPCRMDGMVDVPSLG